MVNVHQVSLQKVNLRRIQTEWANCQKKRTNIETETTNKKMVVTIISTQPRKHLTNGIHNAHLNVIDSQDK